MMRWQAPTIVSIASKTAIPKPAALKDAAPSVSGAANFRAGGTSLGSLRRPVRFQSLEHEFGILQRPRAGQDLDRSVRNQFAAAQAPFAHSAEYMIGAATGPKPSLSGSLKFRSAAPNSGATS